jgi:hypothetical protein
MLSGYQVTNKYTVTQQKEFFGKNCRSFCYSLDKGKNERVGERELEGMLE